MFRAAGEPSLTPIGHEGLRVGAFSTTDPSSNPHPLDRSTLAAWEGGGALQSGISPAAAPLIPRPSLTEPSPNHQPSRRKLGRLVFGPSWGCSQTTRTPAIGPRPKPSEAQPGRRL